MANFAVAYTVNAIEMGLKVALQKTESLFFHNGDQGTVLHTGLETTSNAGGGNRSLSEVGL